MSHQFDTGLGAAQRTVARRAAVTLLSGLKRPTGYLQDVIGFGGIVRTYTDQDGIEFLMKALARTPAIGVQLATRAFETLALGGRQAKSECQLILYFASQHARDALVGRFEMDSVAEANDNADPGLDVIMEHAIELLHGQFPSATNNTIKQIAIRTEQELVTTPTMTIWTQTYAIPMFTYTGSKEFRTAEQLLESIHWRITTDPNEVNRPDPAEAPTSLDTDTELT